MNIKEKRKQYKDALRELQGRKSRIGLAVRYVVAFVRLTLYFILYVGIAAVVAPFLLLRELRNLIAFILYQIWRAHKANRMLQAHGWDVRNEFLKNSKVRYRDFARG